MSPCATRRPYSVKRQCLLFPWRSIMSACRCMKQMALALRSAPSLLMIYLQGVFVAVNFLLHSALQYCYTFGYTPAANASRACGRCRKRLRKQPVKHVATVVSALASHWFACEASCSSTNCTHKHPNTRHVAQPRHVTQPRHAHLPSSTAAFVKQATRCDM